MPNFIFHGGAESPNKDRFYFTKDAEEEASHTLIGVKEYGEDTISKGLSWNVRGWYFVNDILTLIGEDGEYLKYQGTQEIDSGRIDCGCGIFTGARNLSVAPIVWGMGKCICKEEGQGKWSDFSNGIDKENYGINSVNANSSKDCVAVGWHGVIYQLRNGFWIDLDSPVNSNLNDCIVLEGGDYFACGQDGIVLHGVKDQIEVIDHIYDTEDFWSLYGYEGEIYLIASHTAFKIQDKKLVPVYGWDFREFGVYSSLMPTYNGFWVFSERKAHIFKDGRWA